MARLSTDQAESAGDLKITFEKDGEAVSVFVDPEKVRAAGGATALASEIACALGCYPKSGYAACVARCLVTGQCCDGGLTNCTPA